MGLMVECPKCKKRNSDKAKTCTGKKKDGSPCGFALSKHSGRVWWIDYRVDGKRERERIGPNKAAAEQRLRDVKSAITEGRFIKKSPETKTTFKGLAKWYLDLPDVKAKRSYDRDKLSLNRLLPFFGDKLLKNITPARVQAYQQMRLAEPSGRTPQTQTKPATINRELACFKTIFNKAIANGKAEKNPAAGVKLLKENNERDRVLTSEEYVRLLAACPPHLKSIVKVAYHTGMRQGEILALTWGQITLKTDKAFIKLTPEDTKTKEGRQVPLSPELVEMFKAMSRGLPNILVFTYQGRNVAAVKRSFSTACKAASIEDFVFHDLRHTFVTNMRRAGVHDSVIMAITGHKTMSMFLRYNTVGDDELRAAVGWKT